MANLMENLFTKEKDELNKIYKKIKSYCIKLNVKFREADSNNKDEKIISICEACSDNRLLMALLSDLRLRDLYDFDNYIDKNYSNDFKVSDYWIDLGLAYNCLNEDYRFFQFVDEINNIFKNNPMLIINQLGYRATVNSCICSMVNLYGIISFEKAYEIFSHLTLFCDKVSYEEFLNYATSFIEMREDCIAAIYMGNFVAKEYMKSTLKQGLYKISPIPAYYELVSKQGDKPFYTDLDVPELLRYEHYEGFGANQYINDFFCFLKDNFELKESELYNAIRKICNACRNEIGINEIFDMMSKVGLMSKSQKIQKSIVCHIMEVKNNIRLRSNRGYTINEMRILSYDMDRACGSI